MRDYAKVLPRFWTGGTGKKLRGQQDAQLLALYLMTAPAASMTGLYNVSVPTMANDTGITENRVRAALLRLQHEGFSHYDEEEELVWVVNMAVVQVGEELNTGDNRIKGVIREVMTFRPHRFAAMFWQEHAQRFTLGACPFNATSTPFEAPSKPPEAPFEAPSDPLRSQEQDQDQDQEQEQDTASLREPATSKAKKTKPAKPSLHSEVTAAFVALWTEHYRTAYQPTPSDRSQLGRFLNEFDPAETQRLIETFRAYLADPDPFLAKHGYSLAYFCTSSGWNKYRAVRDANAAKAPAYESEDARRRRLNGEAVAIAMRNADRWREENGNS